MTAANATHAPAPLHLLVSHAAARALQPPLAELIAAGRLRLIHLPQDGEAPLDDAQAALIDCAYFSRDLHLTPSPGGAESARSFFKLLERAPRLRWLQIFFAGVSSLTVTGRLQARGVQISTATGAAAEPIAQSIVAALLFMSRGLLHHIDAQRRSAWEPLRDAQVPPPLRGQRATIVGMGAIGRETVALLRPYGLRLCAVRRSSEPVPGCEQVVPYAELASVLPHTDWLVLACPLTEATRKLVDAQALALLPRHAHLVNIARGEVVDEAALIDALRERRLAGAYLDVFEQEPLPAASPLWTLPNALISAHTSGARTDYDEQVHAIFIENLQRMAQGLAPTRLALADS